MKKKIVSMALAMVLSLGTVFSLVACGGNNNNNNNSGNESTGNENLDTKKTQLYVRNYQGGFGNKWLYNGKAKLEEKYKDVSLENGKQGVQVLITDVKETPQISNIQNDVYEVYFVEKVNYLYLQKQNVVEDLTSIVTGTNFYDNKTIESKLTDEQKKFYGIKEDGQTKYYALPHYNASMGIVYDIDLFEERGYFFKDGYENETDVQNMFILDPTDKKSAGPDGVFGNDDDGLPATYADFWNLCQYITEDGNTPLNWGGTNATQFYVTALMIQLMANYQGKEEFMRNFTFDGNMDVVKLDGSGNVVMNGGKPETETVTLTPSENNGYETFRSEAYYYALQFVKKLMDTVGTYSIKENINNNSYKAFDAQREYIKSRAYNGNGRQAMLIDGSWWDSEATAYFAEAGYNKKDCNYGWLPLPAATVEQVGAKKPTMVNTINSLCFVKKGLSDVKKQLAFDFVQLMNCDESLQDFTVETNAYKDFTYDFSGKVTKLSPFGQNLYKAWSTYDLINPNDNNDQYYNTIYTADSSRRYAISSSDQFAPIKFFSDKNMTVENYLAKTYTYIRNNNSLWK